MIVLIPLGGIGKRFKDKGYKNPKALIEIFNKPLIYYLIDSLDLSTIEMICIPYNKEYIEHDFETKLANDYPHINFKFIKLENNTQGAAETIGIALMTLHIPDCPILCLDSDAYYDCDIISLWNGYNTIFSFTDIGSNPIYSYISIDKDNVITDIIEKEKISDNACSGAYGFSSYKTLLKSIQELIDSKKMQKGEYYISGVVKKMMKSTIFKMIKISKNKFHTLGVPSDINAYCVDIINNIKSKAPTRIKGHSTFKVVIMHINNESYIVKSSINYNDTNRLAKQIEKQEQYYHSQIKYGVPKIYHKIMDDDRSSYVMEFLHNSIDCVSFINKYNINRTNWFINEIKNVLMDFLEKCTYSKIDKDVLVNKIISIDKNISNNIIIKSNNNINGALNYLRDNIKNMCELVIPVNHCHGDLTLSNILIDEYNSKLYLIDFLDSFIESPIMDMVKIRQDTKHFWTIHLCNFKFDENKVKILFNYIDNKLDSFFQQYEFYNDTYKYFEILNILRVIQYIKDDNMFKYLNNILHNLIYK